MMLHDIRRWWKYLTCCAWQPVRILVAPGLWECCKCGELHLN